MPTPAQVTTMNRQALFGVGGSSSPWSVPALWDSITISGVNYGWANDTQRGGKVRIRKGCRNYEIQVKDPPGSDGAVVTYRGIHPKAFDIVFYIWTTDQYDHFVNDVLPLFINAGTLKATSTPKSLSISHPSLSALNISSVVIENIGAIEPVDVDGPNMFTCVVGVQEYLPPPPKNTTTTPSGTSTVNQPTAPGLQASAAVQKRQAEIAALKSQAVSIAAAK
jgi:hypothetical protein